METQYIKYAISSFPNIICVLPLRKTLHLHSSIVEGLIISTLAFLYPMLLFSGTFFFFNIFLVTLYVLVHVQQ